MTTALSIWKIYDHPTDYPQEFIARRHEITNEEIKGQPSPFGPADKEAVSPGGRRKIPTQRDDA